MSPISASNLFPDILSTSPLIVLPVGLTVYWVLHKLFFYPLFFSPIRNVPGPPLGHPLWGQFTKVMSSESGIAQ
ncbi:hypothetical protein GYMLUDRAFT_246041 [Collybiopsis luxurians FD-317 M1]|uniref:Uncharacterized protein n=1 Tax=Collybiopsis luxurians FD-317 M1 TaxID=944289 RepID=A0A0D0B5L7_9AGAR|nr:hypothetical protein GYMLUDRAFT_246041 [Collybiopsis luxurians FD-317 M1]